MQFWSLLDLVAVIDDDQKICWRTGNIIEQVVFKCRQCNWDLDNIIIDSCADKHVMNDVSKIAMANKILIY